MTTSYIKRVATAFGVTAILAVGAAYAADDVATDSQLKQNDNTVQAANTSTAVGTSKQAVSNVAKVQARERVDVSSPSYRKFLDEIVQRSGG